VGEVYQKELMDYFSREGRTDDGGRALRARYEVRARTLRQACGCATGAVFFLCALIAVFSGRLTVLFEQFAPGPLHWLLAAGLVLTATGVGKVLGLAVARIRWRLLRLEARKSFPDWELRR